MDTPSLSGALRHLTAKGDPVVDLMIAERLGVGMHDDIDALRARAMAGSVAVGAFHAQGSDGSWGDAVKRRARILPTFWMVKTLAELGLSCHPGWAKGTLFLKGAAHTDDGIMSIDGTDRGVLSCYVGMAASTYLLGDRPDLAKPQIAWIKQYEDVRSRGRSLRSTPVDVWHPDMATRFGGCLAETTCAIGLVKTGKALVRWQEEHSDPEIDDLIASIREAFLEREIYRTSNGGVVPLGVDPSKASDWLEPTYPLDWHTDLIEVMDFVASSGALDRRMQPALDKLRRTQLPDHTWALRRTFRPRHLPLLERRSAHRGSAYITVRVATALKHLGVRVI